MKIKLNILILVIGMCSSENSIYDWHIKTIDRGDTDFGDDLKMQTALNNERQQDLLKFSGHANNLEFDADSIYKHFKANSVSETNNHENIDDMYKQKQQNLLNEPIYKKHEDKNNFQSIFDQIRNYNTDENCKENKPIRDKTVIDNTHTEEEHKASTTNQNHILGDSLDHAKDQNEQNNRTYGYEKSTPADIESFVGTNLFESRDRKCFSTEDVALLAIRKDLEILVPKNWPESLFDDHMVALLMNYFYLCHQTVTGTASLRTRHLVQKAFYDTLGGYLNFKMVPVAKYSFYAGQISLNTAKQVILLHEECKKFLNTNGNGWKAPLQNVLSQLKSVQIEPLHIPETDDVAHGEPSFCMQLDMNTEENQPDNDKMIVQLPKIEAENAKGYLGNIWLPFRRKRTFDMKLESSTYIVAKFYETVTKCYRFENIDQDFFNQQFRDWLMENINIHLSDEEFYPGLGAVLRIAEFLKTSKQRVIGIDKDLRIMLDLDEKSNKYRSYKTRNDLMAKRNGTQHNFKEIINDLQKSDGKKFVLPTSDSPVPKNTKHFLRTFDFSAAQMAIIAIPIISFVLVVLVCCWKCCCKKKKTTVEFKAVKNSSSSSSNRFNSPARFFRIRKNSSSNISPVNYSSNENGNKKYKKLVKSGKKQLINLGTSGTSSPRRKNKYKEAQGGSKGKERDRDSDKSNVQW